MIFQHSSFCRINNKQKFNYKKILTTNNLFTALYIINIFSIYHMADAIRSLRKISKKLEQTFQAITYYTAKHLARSKKYGSQYMEEFQRIAKKMDKQQTHGRITQNKKFKSQKDLLKKQLIQIKAKVEKKQREQRQRKKKDNPSRDQSPQQQISYKEHYSSARVEENYRNKREVMMNKRNQKQMQKMPNKKQIVKGNERQRQIDFNRDFDFNKSFKQRKNADNSIYEQQESKRVQKVVNVVKKPTKWSDRKPLNIGSIDPQKYKILVVDEETSDFQDQDALLKVPQIKPREPLTPYFLFLRVNKHAISKSFPNVNSKRGYAKVWQELPQQQKKPFIDQYNRAQKIYASKLNQYYSINPQVDKIVAQPIEKDKFSQTKKNDKNKKSAPKKRQSKVKSNSKSTDNKKQKNKDSDYQN